MHTHTHVCSPLWGSDQFSQALVTFLSWMFFFAFSLVLHAKYAKSFGACKFPRLVRVCMCVSGVCVCLHIMIIVGTSARNRVRSRVINLDTQLCKSRTRLQQQQPQQQRSLRAKLLLPVGPLLPSLPPPCLPLFILYCFFLFKHFLLLYFMATCFCVCCCCGSVAMQAAVTFGKFYSRRQAFSIEFWSLICH